MNAVPGKVRMILETRSTDEAAQAEFEQQVWARVQDDWAQRGLHGTIVPLSQTVPTACSPIVQGAIEKAAASVGLQSTRLPSGAGHDGVFVSRLAPIGMIFVPCREGRSHAPEEWADPADCANGARVLAETLMLLDQTLS